MDTHNHRGEDDWAIAPWDARRVIRMRKLSILCAALFCLSLAASAQDSSAAFDASNSASEPAAPASLIPADREPWQIGVEFQYLHFNVLGQSFHNLGYQAQVTRYLSNWFGVEGTAVAGFGHTGSSPSIDAKSVFLGGGPHIALFNSRHFEPWGHVIVGWERFRFTQSSTLGSNSHAAFWAGGGVDYKFGDGRLYWRVQGDFIGTNVGPSFSKNYSVGTGFVLNF
jgi:hypothetical protein